MISDSTARKVEAPGAHGWATPTTLGPIELLILQPTPFCNLDCSYCYLRDRSSRSRMSLKVIERAMERLVESELLGDELSVVWHAGEPLVVGVPYYQQAIERISDLVPDSTRVTHHIQTNGVLIDDGWCALFEKYGIGVGVSVDGPQFIHDRARKTRDGRGTHARVVRGMDCLRANGIGYHSISVLTDFSLDYAKEIFDFLWSSGVRSAAFNVEEAEACHPRSSLAGDSIKERVTDFFTALRERLDETKYPLRIREFENALALIMNWDPERPWQFSNSQELVPYRILTVAVDGAFSTFSPELLGEEVPGIGPFVFGNVDTESLLGAAATLKFKKAHREVLAGIERCRQNCSYYELCGGGAPSNKYYENGTFDSDQTVFCTLHKQAVMDVMLNRLERDLHLLPEIEERDARDGHTKLKGSGR